MLQSFLLPPVKAVRIAWARTGDFSENSHSRRYADQAKTELKDIKRQAEGDKKERRYVSDAIAIIEASLRNLDTIYKGRELNFYENEKLRLSHLESVKQSLEFGNKAKDFLKSLPTMTIGSASGITVAQLLGATVMQLWAVGLLFAAVGYLVNWIIVDRMRIEKQWNFILQDYERGLYYVQYLNRVTEALASLYNSIDQIHKTVFNQKYPIDTDVIKIINELLRGIRPTYCDYVKEHLKTEVIVDKKGKEKKGWLIMNGKEKKGRKKKKAMWEQWSVCESGIEEAVEKCRFWEGKKPKEIEVKKT